MRSFDELASILECDDNVVLRVERIRRKEPIAGEDLLECSDLEILRFQLTGSDLCFLCRGESDELEIAKIPDDWNTPHILDLSHEHPWVDVINQRLFSVWQLIEFRGFPDGFQLEFGSVEYSRRIQIDGAASMIRTFTVSDIRANKNAPDRLG